MVNATGSNRPYVRLTLHPGVARSDRWAWAFQIGHYRHGVPYANVTENGIIVPTVGLSPEGTAREVLLQVARQVRSL